MIWTFFDKDDLVICSNVLEHLAHPNQLIGRIPDLLHGVAGYYLTWTNWSPWGDTIHHFIISVLSAAV
jgi:hypothetical protein